MRNKLVVVIPNLNGIPHLKDCLASLNKQTIPITTVLVDNNSKDGSVDFTTSYYPDTILIKRNKNYGFTGGVNPGMEWAIANDYKYVALLNNDAVASKDWAKQLLGHMESDNRCGIATSKITDIKGKNLDSTGEFYTTWGLPFARGRGEPDTDQYNKDTAITAASGGASIYRVSMLKKIGLFDQDFFAYYEDVDISLRALAAGWSIDYVPTAEVRHRIGTTTKTIKGTTTYQTIKNLPWVAIKNLPWRMLAKVLPRLWLAHSAYFWKAVFRGKGFYALKGFLMCYLLIPKKLWQRRKVQKLAGGSDRISKHIVHDLPPGDANLRKVRRMWWALTRRRSTP